MKKGRRKTETKKRMNHCKKNKQKSRPKRGGGVDYDTFTEIAL
jgi:hypothetical protein